MEHEEQNEIGFNVILMPNAYFRAGRFPKALLLFALISLILSLYAFFIGAWPVAGFIVLDVVFVAGAFFVIKSQSVRCERLWLDQNTLYAEAFGKNGVKKCWRFNPRFVDVRLHSPEHSRSGLMLKDHNQTLVMGRFLSRSEQSSLIAALNDAIGQWRRHN